MTLDELYNKSHEGFMWSLCQENASIGLKPYLELYRVTALTKVKDWLLLQLWGLTLNENCSFASVEETSFKSQEPNQHVNSSNRGSKFESCCFLALRNNSKSVEVQQWVRSFVMFYYPNSYGNSIIFLNMSWSTLLNEINGSSIIKCGVHLDI